MPAFGRYWNGEPWVHNPEGGTGIRIKKMTPESALDGARVKHGAMLNWGVVGGSQGPGSQGVDNWDFSSAQIGFDGTQNVDPGPAGKNAPLTFLPGAEGTVLKYVSKANPGSTTGVTQVVDFVTPLTVVAEQPPSARSFRPPVAVTAKIHRWTMDNMDLSMLRSLTPTTGLPDAASALSSVLYKQNVECVSRPQAEQMGAAYQESTYASDNASRKATAALMLSMNIDAAIKEKIAAAFCQMGIDTMARLKLGGVYNFNGGLGGILAGFKLPLVLAGLFLNDAEMLEWADKAQHNVFAEDRQCLYVTQAHIDTYDYIQDDLGMPEWMQNPVKSPTSITRNASGATPQGGTIKSYRAVFCRHHLGQTMALRLIPGAMAAWNNQAFFDLADRYAYNNTFYKDGSAPNSGGTLDWGRTASGSPNRYPATHQAVHDAYRSLSGTGTRWTWPA